MLAGNKKTDSSNKEQHENEWLRVQGLCGEGFYPH